MVIIDIDNPINLVMSPWSCLIYLSGLELVIADAIDSTATGFITSVHSALLNLSNISYFFNLILDVNSPQQDLVALRIQGSTNLDH